MSIDRAPRRQIARAAPQPARQPASMPPVAVLRPPTASSAVGHQFGAYALAPPAASAPVVVQRDGQSALPPMPNLQLTPPSLLQPKPAGVQLRPQYTLRLDAAQQQQGFAVVSAELEAARLRAALRSVRLGNPAAAGPYPAMSAPPAALAPTPPRPQPSPPGNDPLDPAAAPKSAASSDLMDAVLATPEATQLIGALQAHVVGDWSKLSMGYKGALITTAVSIGLGSLTGALASPGARPWTLGALSGQIIPVPGVSWLAIEMSTQVNGIMFGAHVDVGRLLPSSWGFGPSQSSPAPMSDPAVQRAAAPDARGGDALAERITSASSGRALDAGTMWTLQTALGPDVRHLRVHYDAEADSLARALRARAFTSGADVFFSAGAYAPETPAGRQLLAHEATHVVQQAAGPVAGTPTAGGIQLSDPADPHERAAHSAGQRIAAEWDAFSVPPALPVTADAAPAPARGTAPTAKRRA